MKTSGAGMAFGGASLSRGVGGCGAVDVVGRVCVDAALSSGQPCLLPDLCRPELAWSISDWGSVALQADMPRGWLWGMSPLSR